MKKWRTVFGNIASRIMGRYILYNFANDASRDFPIWENKRFLRRPALAKGDGPIGKYRQWAKQFYCQSEFDVNELIEKNADFMVNGVES